MFSRKKREEIAKLSKEKHNREKLEKFAGDKEYEDYDEFLKDLEEEYGKQNLEREDILPLILSAFLVFSPIFIILILILLFTYSRGIM